jgi:hypothetical protein
VAKIEFNLLKVDQTPRNKVKESYPPKPAKTFIPETYKNLTSYRENDLRSPTVKKCIPFLDALTSGYIIPFFQDYIITVDYEKQTWDVTCRLEGKGDHSPASLKAAGAHSSDQLPKGYQDGRTPIGKFPNKWVIKTPPGYSCLFVHPFNTPKTDVEIISGVVDTDTYLNAVLFPFYFKRHSEDKEEKVQIHLKIGDPMVQIIPFKRESWKSSVGEWPAEKTWRHKFGGHLFDFYKKFYWQKKNYN